MDYDFEKPRFDFGKKTRKNAKKKKVPPKSFELKMELVLNNVVNRIYEISHNTDSLPMREIERAVITELKTEFNNTQISKITDLSIRTIRNKLNEYREIQ